MVLKNLCAEGERCIMGWSGGMCAQFHCFVSVLREFAVMEVLRGLLFRIFA